MTLLFKLKNLQAASGTWFLYQIVKPTKWRMQYWTNSNIQDYQVPKTNFNMTAKLKETELTANEKIHPSRNYY